MRYFVIVILLTTFSSSTITNTVVGSALFDQAGSQRFSSDNDFLECNLHSNMGYSNSAKVDTENFSDTFQDHSDLASFGSFDMNRYYDRLWNPKDPYYSDENSVTLIIGLDTKPEAYTDTVAEVSRSQGTVLDIVSIGNEATAIAANVPSYAVSSLAEKVRGRNLARYIEPSVKFEAEFDPNDPYWQMQWGPQKIKTHFAWNTTLGDHSVLVAVIDTGIDYSHPDLSGNYVPLGYDWVNNDNDPKDDNGHGTHCAGIIAATINNAVGIAGVANVSIMAEKGLDASGSGWDYQLANAIVHAVDQGADILSNSWGSIHDSQIIHDAMKYAYDHGAIIVAAAGNDQSSLRGYPAAYDEVVAVTATDSLDYPASFTNFGDWVEVAAPGVNIYSTMPTYTVILNAEKPRNYAYLSGTSMACPHVAGVAALIWSRFPNVTSDWVRAKLRYTTDDLGKLGFDQYYGYGRVNARKAVEVTADHDLHAYNTKMPSLIQPGDNVSISVSVVNFGAFDEVNVTVQMLIDGNLSDSRVLDNVSKGASTTVSFSWNPLVERTYNVTFYVVPVYGETVTDNNFITKMMLVRFPLGFVLFDLTRCNPDYFYAQWIEIIRDKGYLVDCYTEGFLTSNLLAHYDILVVAASSLGYTPHEVAAVSDFVIDGGELSVVGGCGALTSFSGIEVGSESYSWFGPTTNITSHDVTMGIYSLFVFSMHRLFVTPPAISLVRDCSRLDETFLAVAEIGSGRVVAVTDGFLEDGRIGRENHMKLANNIVSWLTPVKPQHEITVRLDYPYYIEPNECSVLNTTVCNRGLSNETNLNLQLLINGSLVNSITIPELASGTECTFSFPFESSVIGTCNVTVYVPFMPDEDVTLNNVETEFVSVRHPVINAVEGQYANYSLYCYDSSGNWVVGGCWNFTYGRFVERYKMNITVQLKTTYGYTDSFFEIVNTMDRLIESGPEAYTYYFSWIETDIDTGSEVKLESFVFPVSGSRIVIAGARAFDCWEIKMWRHLGYPYLHDKTSGLLIKYESFTYPDFYPIEWLLTDTNIPFKSPHEHDLGVSIDTKMRIKPSESLTLNPTLYNLGLDNETDVQFMVLVNGTEVETETITKLSNGTWHSMNLSWTPTTEGSYNITVYTPLRPDEGTWRNNIVSKIVLVRYREVALISDYSYLMELAPILDSMGLGFDLYNYNVKHLFTENLTLLREYRAVVYWKTLDLTANEYNALSSYLYSGGNLLISGSMVLDNDLLATDLVRSYMSGHDMDQFDLFVADESHPIVNGPYGRFVKQYHIRGLNGACSIAKANERRHAISVAELADGYDKIIATEGIPGKVVFWNGMGIFDWLSNNDCQIMFKNLMYWFTTYQLTIKVTSGGTTIPSPGTYFHTSHILTQVAAVPNMYYVFDHWNLDAANVGSTNPYSVLMDKDHTLEAVFAYLPPLSVSISPLSASMKAGQSLVFTSVVAGGTPPYRYQWYLNEKQVLDATSDNWVFTPSTSGTHRVYLKVTDFDGNVEQSETSTITVTANSVGGYTTQAERYQATEPLTLYLAIVATATVTFISIRTQTTKRKKTKDERNPRQVSMN